MAVIKKIPASEIRKVLCKAKNGEYLITQRTDNKMFYLYRKTSAGFEKFSPRGVPDPTAFDDIIWKNESRKTK